MKEQETGDEKQLDVVVGLEIWGAVYGNALVGRLASEKEELGLIGTLNSGIDEASGVSSYNLSTVFRRMDGGKDDPGVGNEILVADEDTGGADNIEGTVREVDADVADNDEGEGETLGREMEGTVGASVMGSPRSFTKFKTFAKSESLWNFN